MKQTGNNTSQLNFFSFLFFFFFQSMQWHFVWISRNKVQEVMRFTSLNIIIKSNVCSFRFCRKCLREFLKCTTWTCQPEIALKKEEEKKRHFTGYMTKCEHPDTSEPLQPQGNLSLFLAQSVQEMPILCEKGQHLEYNSTCSNPAHWKRFSSLSDTAGLQCVGHDRR